ncbi:MAG: thiamine-phosphate kinase [Pseudomonadota bacterium]|nr:thiamine-phosphate kinase [Pseudomonadota bacterium]
MTTPNRPGEFALIERFFKPLSRTTPFVRHGIGDDCAVLSPAADEELVLSVDTLVEGVHFPRHYAPAKLAVRSLAVCISDLAAAGAHPEAFTLALTAPELNESWLAEFSRVLAAEAERYGVSLVGGDTTRGPLCLSLQVMGSVPRGQALLRNGARPGDLVYVSGELGGARAALDYLETLSPTDAQQSYLQRYHSPLPRLALGQALRGVANAAVDISDGLVADLGHILRASGVGATIYTDRLPVAMGLRDVAKGVDYALSGGDDYELCFTVPEEYQAHLRALEKTLALPLHCIGEVVDGAGLKCLDAEGVVYETAAGYQHF